MCKCSDTCENDGVEDKEKFETGDEGDNEDIPMNVDCFIISLGYL